MRGTDQPSIHCCQQQPLHCPLAFQIQDRWRALLPRVNTPKIFSSSQILAGFTDEKNLVAFSFKTRRDGTVGVFQNPHHADTGRWIDRQTACLIIKAHVPAHHWYF